MKERQAFIDVLTIGAAQFQVIGRPNAGLYEKVSTLLHLQALMSDVRGSHQASNAALIMAPVEFP